ncbi:hypothetical protein OURE66S_00691 [Oligella ureolytica]
MSNQSNSEVSIEAVEPHETLEPSSLARRDMFKIAGAGLASPHLIRFTRLSPEEATQNR